MADLLISRGNFLHMELATLYRHQPPGAEYKFEDPSESPFRGDSFEALEKLLGDLDRRGITLRGLHLLIHLRNAGNDLKRLSELADVVGLTGAGLTGIADQLEQKGLAVRVLRMQDRRCIYLTLTPAGATFVEWIAESLRGTLVADAH
jgi:DNA-binding MarR family transcriptional regulator